MYETKHYTTSNGVDVIVEWYRRSKDTTAKHAIDRRIARVERGNFGDHKFLRDGVWELRIDVGPGYRVYYAHEGKTVVLLLCVGAKGRQDADISTAVTNWSDWQNRPKEENDERPTP
ncbi:MAG: type II toxin-antitoxin system RelE/ParE family toxin [Acidobacteriaceae bacterium]|nr:type II toxin-antitoxin system RelE/ParE family toxin [Acidobacteriaceae bacterium]